jgi:hypothetical protein
MNDELSRRELLAAPGIGLVAALLHGIPNRTEQAGEEADAAPAALWPEFPRQAPERVKEIASVAHFDEQRVRELIDAQPALANAWWDWGAGDWESPLGAASHVGRRTIAEFLIQRGARIDIFAAAMLGHTEIVKALVAARPGVQRTLGPHNIPLLAHARAGGPQASETLAYLESLGDAGQSPRTVDLSAAEKQPFVGQYRFGADPIDRLEVKLEKEQLSIGRPGFADRRLHYVGENAFVPAGAPVVRIRFQLRDGKAATLTVVDNVSLVEATRVAG